MTTLDDARAAIRRRAIAEDWPATLLAMAEDFADTAREDGTHALRSRDEQAERLGVSVSTVQRHRRELERLGVVAVRRRGGNGRGSTVVDLVTPDPSSGSRARGTVTPNSVESRGSRVTSSGSPSRVDVTPDSVSSGSVGGQSRVTVTPDRDPCLLSSSPATAGSDLADRLAATKGWPLDHCRRILAAKRDELAARPGTRNPDAVLARIVATSPGELPAPTYRPPAIAECDGTACPGNTHGWEDGPNRYVCHGIAAHV